MSLMVYILRIKKTFGCAWDVGGFGRIQGRRGPKDY